jgi:plasmid maintenance system antidote protein VapI
MSIAELIREEADRTSEAMRSAPGEVVNSAARNTILDSGMALTPEVVTPMRKGRKSGLRTTPQGVARVKGRRGPVAVMQVGSEILDTPARDRGGDPPLQQQDGGSTLINGPQGGQPRKAEAFIQWMQVPLARKLVEPATRRALKKNHLLVLMMLVNCAEFGNEVILTQREIAERLGFPDSRLSAVLSVLEDHDFLTRSTGISRTFSVMLNPRYFLKQSKAMWAEIQDDYDVLREARTVSKKERSASAKGRS